MKRLYPFVLGGTAGGLFTQGIIVGSGLLVLAGVLVFVLAIVDITLRD